MLMERYGVGQLTGSTIKPAAFTKINNSDMENPLVDLQKHTLRSQLLIFVQALTSFFWD